MMDWLFKLSCSNDSTSVELEDEPIDWEDYAITMKREPKLHGKMISMSNSLTFYGEGYQFIKDKYDAYGIQADLTMQVLLACEGGWESLPGSRIDMGTLDFEEGSGCYVSANLEESSCIMKFKNRKGLKVDLFSLDTVDHPGIDVLPPYTLLNHRLQLAPKVIIKTLQYFYNDQPAAITVFAQQIGTTQGALSFDFFIHMMQTDAIEELEETNEDFSDGDTAIEADVPFLFKIKEVSSLWNFEVVYEADVDVTVFLDNLSMDDCAPTDRFEDVTFTLKLRKFDGFTTTIHTIGTQSFPGCHVNLAEHLSFAFAGPFPWPVALDDEISVYLEATVTGDYSIINALDPMTITVNVDVTDNLTSFVKLTLPTTYPATDARVAFPNEALSRIVEKLTGGCLKVYSQYFGHATAQPYDREDPDAPEDTTGCGALQSVTSGGMIRRLLNEQFFISWNELYNGYNAINALGMGIEDDPNHFVSTYTWDLTAIIALTDIEQGAAVKTILVNSVIVSVSASDVPGFVIALNGIGADIFTLNGVLLSVNAESNIYGEIEFAPYVIDVNPVVAVTTEVTERIRVERATFFYEPDAMAFLVDYPTVIHRSIRTETFFTKLTIGYSSWEAEEYNGLDEFATKREYTTRINQIDGEMSVLSQLIASGYAIEVTRQQSISTKDWRYDNNPFVIQTTEDRTENEHGNIDSPANLIDPNSVYNFRLSPARNAIRWFEFIFTMFKDYLDSENAKLLFVSGEGNYIAEGLVTGGCVPETAVLNESQDLVYTDKSDSSTEFPRLGWEEWQFEYPVEFSDYLTIRDNFYKKIPVRWHGQLDYQEAYISEIVYRPAQSIASFTLIKAVPVSEDDLCDDNLLLETGLDYFLEDGTCILLEYA